MSPWRHHFKVTFRCNRGANESFLASFVCLFVRETPQDHLRGVDVSTLRSLHVPVGLQDDLKAFEVAAEAKFLRVAVRWRNGLVSLDEKSGGAEVCDFVGLSQDAGRLGRCGRPEKKDGEQADSEAEMPEKCPMAGEELSHYLRLYQNILPWIEMGTVPVRLPGLADVTRPLSRLLEYPEHVHVVYPFVLSYSPHPRRPAASRFIIANSTVHVGLRLFRSAQSRLSPSPLHFPSPENFPPCPALILLYFPLSARELFASAR